MEATKAAGDDGIRVAGPRGRISLRLEAGVLRVTLEGEPPGEYFVDSFREGVNRGLARPGTPTLVELTRFRGVVDWSSIVMVRALAPWGKANGSPVAYVGLDSMLGMLVNIAATLFPASRHRLFASEIEAMEWLRVAPEDNRVATSAS